VLQQLSADTYRHDQQFQWLENRWDMYLAGR
jgi:hypothetical protein